MLLVVLVADTLDAQLAQNDAGLARATAIAQARSAIVQAEARPGGAERLRAGQALKAAGHVAESAYDQRQQASRTADAQLVAARGLKVAEAEKAQIEAQRRELNWRRGRTEVVAPADGIVSRRMPASAATPPAPSRCSASSPRARWSSTPRSPRRMVTVKIGQPARVEVAGVGEIVGTVRLVSPEVDKATRLGRVRIFLGDNPELRVGAFARGAIETGSSHGLAVPASVLYGPEGSSVQVVRDHKVETRRIKIDLTAGGLAEVREGLQEGELVVARSGTFLRDGDAAWPLPANRNQLSNAN